MRLAYLLDTSAAIELRDGGSRAMDAVRSMPMLPEISVISQVELEGGVYSRPDISAQRRRLLNALLGRLTVIPFDAKMAVTYGLIVRHFGFDRRKSLDRMIAATAITRNRVLITSNARDFIGIPDLELEVWNA